jgi:hypothetical protein
LKTHAVAKLRCAVLPHTPFSQDVAASDFLLFGALRGAIHGKEFGDDDIVI